MFFANRTKAICFAVMLLLAVASVSSADTIVRFETTLGDFDVQLYDTTVSNTVENFLNYVNSGRFDDSLFHRLVSGFVLQGGTATYNGTLAPVASFGEIQNEFHASRSNLRGTLAMAKRAGEPNSATSSFFINLVNNDGSGPTSNLDADNGGYTVFAEVMGNGMDVVDALASVQTFPFGSPFNEIPLLNYTSDDFPTAPVGADNFEMYNITIVEPLAGDFDADNDVEGTDFGFWQTGYPTASGATLADGDADGDGDVDGTDFGLWQANYPTNMGSAAAIPEPATLGLMLVSGLALLHGKRRFRPSL